MTINSLPVPADKYDERVTQLGHLLGLYEIVLVAEDQIEDRFRVDWCWFNAFAKSSHCGGEVVHGWAIWDVGGAIVAQHHSVWRTPEGFMIDVTPKEGQDSEYILFAPSSRHSFDYEGLRGWASVIVYDNLSWAVDLGPHVPEAQRIIAEGALQRPKMEPPHNELMEIRELVPNAGTRQGL